MERKVSIKCHNAVGGAYIKVYLSEALRGKRTLEKDLHKEYPILASIVNTLLLMVPDLTFGTRYMADLGSKITRYKVKGYNDKYRDLVVIYCHHPSFKTHYREVGRKELRQIWSKYEW